MVKANELRIGNRLLCEGKEIIVNGIYDNSLYCNLSKYNKYFFKEYIDYFEPIRLTDKLLLSLHVTKNTFESYSFGIIKLYYKKKFKYFAVYIDVNYLTQIEYLHELQNLYFAINGTELI